MAKPEYIAEKPLSFKELLRLRERARKIPKFKEWACFEYVGAEGKFDVLPAPGAFRDMELLDITVHGQLPLRDSSLEQLRTILLDGAAHLGDRGVFGIRCCFQERTGKQTKTWPDSLAILVRNGKLEFFYNSSKGSGAADLAYRKAMFHDMIQQASLPLRVVNQPGGFILEATDREPGKEDPLFNGKGLNPDCFSHKNLPGPLESVFDRLLLLLTRHASSKRFEYKWVSTSYEPGATPAEFYRQLHSRNYAAQKYEVLLCCHLNGLEAVEDLRQFMGDSGDVTVELFSWPLPNRNRAYLEADTTAAGYVLTVKLTDPDYLETVEQQLGLRFPGEPPV